MERRNLRVIKVLPETVDTVDTTTQYCLKPTCLKKLTDSVPLKTFKSIK